MAQLWDAGLDWLTMTFEPGHRDYIRAMQNVRAEMSLTADAYDPIKPLSLRGYIGEQQGALKYGEREDGLMVQCSGARTRQLGELFRRNNIDGKPTRIDIQATAKIKSPAKIYLAEVERRVAEATGEQAGRAAKNTTNYKNRGRSTGVAIGHRTSSGYSRIYDKFVESGGRTETGLIRFEHEAKGKRARVVWNMYRNAAQPYYLNCSLIKSEMERLGCDMEWLVGVEQIEFPSEYAPTSIERKMSWFKKHVRPSVAACVEASGREAVLEALGLDNW